MTVANSKSNKRSGMWIFTVVFALLVKVAAISCLTVYLIDKAAVNGLSDSNQINASELDQLIGEEQIINIEEVICSPLICDPTCLEEWFDGDFQCEVDAVTSIVPAELKQKKPSKTNHKPKLLSKGKLSQVAGLTDIGRMFRDDLEPLLIPRVAGTPGSAQARRHIVGRLESLTGWDVVQDSFIDTAPQPFGDTEFVNIIATRLPNPINGQQPPDAARRLVFACHYDSKYFAPRRDGQEFVGATDSAVPCAMMLDLAYSLDRVLQASPLTMVTLQLMFFDGEEAFVNWQGTDNTYGARDLAAKLAAKPYPPGNRQGHTELDRIDMLILLDLIGVSNPQFINHFPSTTGKWFQHMQKVETRLKTANLLEGHTNPYFKRGGYGGGIEDDHIPFIRRGVPAFHVIDAPFPWVWHRMSDNINALHKPTIKNLNKMFQIFTVEYLHLRKSIRKRRRNPRQCNNP